MRAAQLCCSGTRRGSQIEPRAPAHGGKSSCRAFCEQPKRRSKPQTNRFCAVLHPDRGHRRGARELCDCLLGVYRLAPFSILDIRDGGFHPWAGARAGISVSPGSISTFRACFLASIALATHRTAQRQPCMAHDGTERGLLRPDRPGRPTRRLAQLAEINHVLYAPQNTRPGA